MRLREYCGVSTATSRPDELHTVTGTVGPGTGVPTPAAGKGDKTSRDVDAFWFEAVRDAS